MRNCIKYIINCTLQKYYQCTVDHGPESPSKYMTTIYHYFCMKMEIFRLLKVKQL